MLIITMIAGLVLVGIGYVRFAPSDGAKWHQMPAFDENRDLAGGVMRIEHNVNQDQFAHLIDIAQNWPRTVVLTGSVDSGKITLMTRTRWIGFPDYSTIEYQNGTLRIYARLRFGRSDLGVNTRRIKAWLDQI